MNVFKNFLRLKIRLKLLIAFGSILLLSVILIITTSRSILHILKYKSLNEEISILQAELFRANLAKTQFEEKGFKQLSFLEKEESEYLQQFQESCHKIHQILKKLPHTLSDELVYAKTQIIYQNLTQYQQNFKKIIRLYEERGFQDHGVEGALRQAIHQVENSSFPYHKATMLMLRRHEKDFFLRKNAQYLLKFNAAMKLFLEEIRAAPAHPLKEEILLFTHNYQQRFHYIVELEKKIGLSETEGLKGKINSIQNRIFPQIFELVSLVKTKSKQLIKNAVITVIVLFLLQLIIGFILIFFYSNLLTQSIKEIRNNMVSLSRGTFPERLPIRSKDEIAHTKKALNNLVERIKTATAFTRELGDGNLTVQYDKRFQQDVWARSILSLQGKLAYAEQEREKNHWTNKGLAHFNKILKGDLSDIKKLGDSIIQNLIEYLQINQGALFLIETDPESQQKYLQRISTYAFQRKKFVRQKIEDLEDNIIGQAILTQKAIHLTKVPAQYLQIKSGLGTAPAQNVLIVPLQTREEVIGVIELATFHTLEPYQVAFVERLSETIANTLLNQQKNAQTRQLLEESQRKTEILSAQEEELRQNTEELQSTQEELLRQKQSMELEIDFLKKELIRNPRKLVKEPS